MAENLKQKISDILDLPKDIVLNLCRITITGRIAVFIENHKGIMEYTSDRVKINTGNGLLIIKGEGLVLKTIIVDEITVEGKINSIEYED